MAKKKCNCKPTKTEQTSFLAYQSGSDDKAMMDMVIECIGELTVKLKENGIRLYSVIQSGVPPGGGCIPGQPGCPK